MFYLRVKLRFYGLDEKSFFYFTFKIISGACQDIGTGGVTLCPGLSARCCPTAIMFVTDVLVC